MQKYSPFSDMPEYAFPRLRRLLSNLKPGCLADPVILRLTNYHDCKKVMLLVVIVFKTVMIS